MKRTLIVLSLILLAYFIGHSQDAEKYPRKENLELWADSLIKPAMKNFHIPGLTFAIVSKDSMLLLKGYGKANLKSAAPIDPLRSHFDMGSIPKALTAVALMQLVDQGKIDVYEDIKSAFPFLRYKNGIDKPISLHQLLTHSAGLDDLSNLASASRSPNEVPSLQDFINSQAIYKVMDGGKMSSYSNIGYAMIGALIEQKSGRSFPDYMQEFLLAPLSMNYSSFYAKLNDSMEIQRALGYEFINDSFQPAPVNYQFNSPAAGLRSTGADMANFVQMLLNEGRFRGKQILSPKSLKKILSRQFSNHPELPALGYSLREESYDGWKVWGQNGAWQGFNHDFFLIPEAGLGLLICLNTDEGSQLAQGLIKDFVRTYLAPKQIQEVVSSQSSPELEAYAGMYRGTRFSRNSITKMGVLLGFVSELEVGFQNDSLFYYGTALLYEGNDVFRRADGLGRIAFLRNDDGKIEGLARSYSHYEAHQKIGFYQSSKFQLMLFGLIFLSLLLIAVFSVLQYFKRKPKDQVGIFDPKANNLAILSSLLPIIWLLGLGLEFSSVGQWDYQYGATLTLKFLLALPFFFLALQAYMIYYFFNMKANFHSKGSRLLFILASLTLLAFLLFLYKWNLLGYQY